MTNPMEVPAPMTPSEREQQIERRVVHMGRRTNGTRTGNIQVTIIEFMQDHPNKEFSIDTIALQTTLPRPSVQNAMSKLVRDGHLINGRFRGLYQYNSENQDELSVAINQGDKMEVLRVRNDSDIVLMDGHGDFWVATRVNI